jgi:phosphoribosylglycinamide formyltransferase-1
MASAAKQQVRLDKLVAFVESLPRTTVTGERDLRFQVGKKTFGYYLNNHHGDGVLSICCKATFAEQAELVESDPRSYYIPPYIGPKGWVALRVDLPRFDWKAVKWLLSNAYRHQAPRKLAELI